MPPLILIGASGLAREVASALADGGELTVTGILDDDATLHGTTLAGVPVLGDIASAVDHPAARLVVCTGSGDSRAAIVDRLALLGIGADRYATVLATGVQVPPGCQVGLGSILLGHTTLTADVIVGRHVVMMPHVVCTHDNLIGDFATLCAGVVLGGEVIVGPRSYLGMNASVRQRVRIGDGATLGMGSVLLSDVPCGSVWAGNPAKPLTRKAS